MRIYDQNYSAYLQKAFCNKCGKELKVVDGIIREGYLSCEEQFGYFSNKDGEIHKFDLCEECYDELIKQFKLPVDKKHQEVLV